VLWIEARFEVKQVSSQGLLDGMILDDDVYTRNGTLLVAKGQEVTYLLRKRLQCLCGNQRPQGTPAGARAPGREARAEGEQEFLTSSPP
jgi:hypothetical protein